MKGNLVLWILISTDIACVLSIQKGIVNMQYDTSIFSSHLSYTFLGFKDFGLSKCILNLILILQYCYTIIKFRDFGNLKYIVATVGIGNPIDFALFLIIIRNCGYRRGKRKNIGHCDISET